MKFMHLSNGDYNEKYYKEGSLERIDWELNEGGQEWILITNKKLKTTEYDKLLDILKETK